MPRDLTPRQSQILELVAAGPVDKEIAARLHLSLATVRTHLQRLYRERGYRNRAEAAAEWVALRSRLEAPPPAAVAGKSGGRRRSAVVVVGLPAAALVGLLVSALLMQPGLLLETHGQVAARSRTVSDPSPSTSSELPAPTPSVVTAA